MFFTIFFIVYNILQRFTPALPYPRPQPAIPYHLPGSIPSRARCALQPWNPWKPRTAMAVVRLALAGLVRRPARCLVRSASSTSVMSHSEFVDIVDCVLGCEKFGNLSKHNSGLKKKWSFNAVDNHLGIGLYWSLYVFVYFTNGFCNSWHLWRSFGQITTDRLVIPIANFWGTERATDTFRYASREEERVVRTTSAGIQQQLAQGF